MSLYTTLSKLFTVDKKDAEAVNNGGLTSLSDQTLDYYVDVNTFSSLSIFYDIGGTGVCTLTVEASNDEVAQGDAGYLLFHTDVFGGTSWTSDAFLMSLLPITAKWIHIKIVISGGETDNSVKLFARKGYR